MGSKRTTKPRFIDDQTAAIIGKVVLLEEQCGALTEALDAAQQQIARQNSRIIALEERLVELTRPRTLLTIAETAQMLVLCERTLKRWRDEIKPRIPFIVLEGGDIRYRVDAIEQYLKSRERSKPKPRS